MIILTFLMALVALACLFLAALLLTQVLSACAGGGGASPVVASAPPSIAVLIPAHDEAAGITATLKAIMPQLTVHDRVVVVADNCTDTTAAVAAAAGAEVVIRTNTALRGKGYALDFGVNYLSASAPDVVIVIDADCHVYDDVLPRLGSACQHAGVPLQALYLMHAPPNAGLKTRIAEFAWILKNKVRPLGYHLLSLPCHLTGTGMAFPWSLIKNSLLATGNITEDMQLGVDLALAGFPPRFFPEAIVTSQFPDAESGLKSQRVRWEHGHLATILHAFPRMLLRGFKKRDAKVIFMAIDLAVPPLALFALMLAVSVTGSAVLTWVHGAVIALPISLLAVLLFAIAIFVAWFQFARAVVSLSELLSAPLYVLAKLPIYLKFWTRRQKAWVRTDRE